MNAGVQLVSDLGQVAVTVSDVARAKEFYHGVLGLRHLFDAGPDLAFLSAGNVRLMLTLPQGAGAAGKNSILYFRVSGLESAYPALLARGATGERAPQLTGEAAGPRAVDGLRAGPGWKPGRADGGAPLADGKVRPE